MSENIETGPTKREVEQYRRDKADMQKIWFWSLSDPRPVEEMGFSRASMHPQRIGVVSYFRDASSTLKASLYSRTNNLRRQLPSALRLFAVVEEPNCDYSNEWLAQCAKAGVVPVLTILGHYHLARTAAKRACQAMEKGQLLPWSPTPPTPEDFARFDLPDCREYLAHTLSGLLQPAVNGEVQPAPSPVRKRVYAPAQRLTVSALQEQITALTGRIAALESKCHTTS